MQKARIKIVFNIAILGVFARPTTMTLEQSISLSAAEVAPPALRL